ncbi:serine hydrolase domain-containing protein [Ekhidna sp.]
MKKIAISSIIILSIINTCYSQQSYTYSEPNKLEDAWLTTSLHSLNVDTSRIYQLFTQVLNNKNELHSVLLVKNGRLIIEEYFNNYSVNKQHDLRSTTKSIRSILMGIAIDEGFIVSIEDPISKYLKSHSVSKNQDSRKKEISIKHLLTMSTGLDCNDWDKKSAGQEDKVYKKKDWIQYTLDLPMINDPGTVSTYCSMGVLLIAEIISQASGLAIDEFAEKYLFNPLGITNVSWGHTSSKEVIPSGKRIYMTSRDMAKIGQLVLNKGKWDNTQVVSSKWIEESTTPKTKITGIDYGYLWWNIPFKAKEQVVLSKTATGNGGQYIMILPELDMVAVFTGGAYNSQEDKLPFAIMNNVLLPTFDSDK